MSDRPLGTPPTQPADDPAVGLDAGAGVPVRPGPDASDATCPQRNDVDTWVEPEIELDSGYYERGTAARRRDHEALEDLTDSFDEIEDRADALLEELLVVMEGVANL